MILNKYKLVREGLFKDQLGNEFEINSIEGNLIKAYWIDDSWNPVSVTNQDLEHYFICTFKNYIDN